MIDVATPPMPRPGPGLTGRTGLFLLARRAGLLCPALLLTACASLDAGPPLPRVQYVTGGSYTDPNAIFAEPPTPASFEVATRTWTDAVADASACRLPPGEVRSAGLVAAAELAVMGASARTGERRGEGAAMARYAADMALAAAGTDRRPTRARCQRLSRWLPEVNAAGGAALRQGMFGGLRDLLGTRDN